LRKLPASSQIGVESYYVVINSERGFVAPEMPANVGGFDHVVLAIKLPGNASDPSLIATMDHPRLGKILFYDPTNELTPWISPGQLRPPRDAGRWGTGGAAQAAVHHE
jgi:hypothetical protein